MQLKRYSTQELQELCTDIFYTYMSSMNGDSWRVPTPVHALHQQYLDQLGRYRERENLYRKEIFSNGEKPSLVKQLGYIEEAVGYLCESNMQAQKKLYESTGSTDFARTSIRIPLDKKINSYYDDLTLEVVFYDDVCTLNGKFDEYNLLRTEKERRAFLEENTEVTNMGLLYIRNNSVVSITALKGDLNDADPRVLSTSVVLLPQIFSDFNKLTLKDTSLIKNNDLKQLIQSKIDLDKENMEELSSVIIRGDRYSIHQAPDNGYYEEDLYIRYTCRGTGRVYFNRLNLNNLQLSSYFKENDFDSYCRAWWDLNTLGGNPDNEKPVIRC